MLNYFMMCLIIVTLFDVPVKGSFYPHSCCISVCDFCHRDGFIGIHSDQKSDCVNVFGDDWDVGACHAICRIINPVTSLDGFGRWFGEIYPATHMVNISRGIFNKGLGFQT